MHIPSHHIQKVLTQFSRQIGQRNGSMTANADQQVSTQWIDISEEGKRRTINEKVNADVMERITRLNQEAKRIWKSEARETNDTPQASSNPLFSQSARSISDAWRELKKKPNLFFFNSIDENNEKQTHVLPVEYPEAFLKRLEAIATQLAQRIQDYRENRPNNSSTDKNKEI